MRRQRRYLYLERYHDITISPSEVWRIPKSLDMSRYIVRDGEMLTWPESSPKLRPDGFFGHLGAHWQDSPQALVETIEAAGVDYLVLSGSWIDLFRADQTDFPSTWAVYETLLDTYPVIESIDRDDATLGAPVLVLETARE